MFDNPTNYICTDCQSENVARDAFAYWDTELQNWQVQSVFDDWICDDCGSTACPTEQELTQ